MKFSPTSKKSAFWLGYRDNIPFWLIVAPFGLLFGVVATEAGFSILQTMIMTSFVVAGSSQFTALTLLQDDAPTFIILATSLAVNLRMAMYSAALVPHLGRAPLGIRALFAYFLVDQSYATSINIYSDNPEMTLPQKCRYFMGSFACLLPVWIFSTLIGALLGTKIPPEYALDFAMPICFIASIGTNDAKSSTFYCRTSVNDWNSSLYISALLHRIINGGIFSHDCRSANRELAKKEGKK